MRGVTEIVTTALTLLDSNDVNTYFVSYGSGKLVEVFIIGSVNRAAELLNLDPFNDNLATGLYMGVHFTIYGRGKNELNELISDVGKS